MPLIACHECGKEVSTEAHACPHCGAPVRIEKSGSRGSARAELKNPQLWLFVLVLAIVAIWTLNGEKPSSIPERSIATPNVRVPAYKVVEQWTITNGGFGRTIVVAPNPTEENLRALGDRLRQDTKNDRNAIVFVYDDDRAAANRLAAILEKLASVDLRHHDRHRVAMYLRNANTGFHELDITPGGIDGPSANAKY